MRAVRESIVFFAAAAIAFSHFLRVAKVVEVTISARGRLSR